MTTGLRDSTPSTALITAQAAVTSSHYVNGALPSTAFPQTVQLKAISIIDEILVPAGTWSVRLICSDQRGTDDSTIRQVFSTLCIRKSVNDAEPEVLRCILHALLRFGLDLRPSPPKHSPFIYACRYGSEMANAMLDLSPDLGPRVTHASTHHQTALFATFQFKVLAAPTPFHERLVNLCDDETLQRRGGETIGFEYPSVFRYLLEVMHEGLTVEHIGWRPAHLYAHATLFLRRACAERTGLDLLRRECGTYVKARSGETP
jgi:hypothetical protein